MPLLQSRFFGELEFRESDVFTFPSGLPGFESSHQFVFLNRQGYEPLTFLQNVEWATLCFILLPIQVVEENYTLELTEEERHDLGFDATVSLRPGNDYMCAAIVCVEETGPTVNLMAPIVINLRANKGMQVIRHDSGYSHRSVLHLEAFATC